ncbi:MAG TPA: endonuclease MutS2 [Anaerolineae bacterium]|nr:endonuclease MutS2 [Anaerolineae bacterium]
MPTVVFGTGWGMEAQHWLTLELNKVLDRLARYTSFSAGSELAAQLVPSTFSDVVEQRLAETREARSILVTRSDLGLGGVHDIRSFAADATRGIMLLPIDLLAVRSTLIASRDIRRTLIKAADQFPRLAAIAQRLFESSGIINEISRCIDENNSEVRDDATPELAAIRRELRDSSNRLQDKLRRMISSTTNAKYLQEAIITQRSGRFVIPVKAEYRSRVPGIVHDQSASGATLFVEPLSTVELNNKLRELQLREEREVQRVLQMLSGLIAQEAQPITYAVEALAELDVILAKARYCDDLQAIEPALNTGRRSMARLIRARHPLLDPATVVPLDLELDPDLRVVVITGPNTGGKTVALKTVGLMILMTQCGLHIPASSGSEVSIFDQVYADIGDEQSIEQSLSTFSSHVVNIVGFIDRVTAKSLVLLDELGAGTDPTEGSALARSILDHLSATDALTIVATHYPELKVWAHSTQGAINASVEFDPETLRPTYKLTVGLPGRSNAFAIAKRLGLKDDIVSHARSMVAEDNLKAEDLLAEIHQQREATERSRASADRLRDEAEKLTRQLRDRLSAIEQERASILEAAQSESQQLIDTFKDQIDQIKASLLTADQATILTQLDQLEAQAESIEPPGPIEKPAINPRHSIRLGDTVYVRKLNATGDVASIDRDTVEVIAGSLRMRLKPDEIEWRSSPNTNVAAAHERPEAVEYANVRSTTAAHIEIDLRGLRADEAVTEAEKQIDAASLAGLPYVRIIHGKGTGALRKAIREALKNNPAIKNLENGKDEEGGDGVTIAHLKV